MIPSQLGRKLELSVRRAQFIIHSYVKSTMSTVSHRPIVKNNQKLKDIVGNEEVISMAEEELFKTNEDLVDHLDILKEIFKNW